jgi:hypothetical protein
MLPICQEGLGATWSRARPEGVFGLQREAPACLVELVDGDCPLGHFEYAVGVAAFEARACRTLQQAEQCRVQAADMSVGPGVVATFKRLAAPKRYCCFEGLRFVAFRVCVWE